MGSNDGDPDEHQRADDSSAWSLAALVADHEAIDDREVQSKQRFLAELRRVFDAPWDRDADLVHLTSSAVIAGWRGVVLHRHRLLGRWMQPGGHLEPASHHGARVA